MVGAPSVTRGFVASAGQAGVHTPAHCRRDELGLDEVERVAIQAYGLKLPVRHSRFVYLVD